MNPAEPSSGSSTACGLPPTRVRTVHNMDAADSPAPMSFWMRKAHDVFGVDLRSLALCRIAVGTVLLSDLIARSRDLTAFYTDDGVIPRVDLLLSSPNEASFCVHMMGGSFLTQAVLFLIQGLFALMFIFGFRTRIATIVSWSMIVSLQNRNPGVCQGGDILLRLMLFFGMFLPMGARFSIDSALNTNPRPRSDRHLSVAGFAILFQLCLVYWIAGAHKNYPVWLEGRALYYALNIDIFATHAGIWLREHEAWLPFLTYVAVYTEKFGATLMWVPFFTGPLRLLTVLTFMGMHIAFGTFLDVGLFSYIGFAAWTVAVPSWFWDRLFAWISTKERLGLTIYYDAQCTFCRKSVLMLRTFFLLPQTRILTCQSDAKASEAMQERSTWSIEDHQGNRHESWAGVACLLRCSPWAWPLGYIAGFGPIRHLGSAFYRWISTHRGNVSPLTAWLVERPIREQAAWYWRIPTSIAVGAIIAYIAFWNLVALEPHQWMFTVTTKDQTYKLADFSRYRVMIDKWPKWWREPGYFMRVDQAWNMFSPQPQEFDGWYVIPARLMNRETVDLWNEGKPVVWTKPDYVLATYRNGRWQKYLDNLTRPNYTPFRRLFSRYLIREWNQRHDVDHAVLSLQFCFMLEQTMPDGIAPVRKLVLSTESTGYFIQSENPDENQNGPAPDMSTPQMILP